MPVVISTYVCLLDILMFKGNVNEFLKLEIIKKQDFTFIFQVVRKIHLKI